MTIWGSITLLFPCLFLFIDSGIAQQAFKLQDQGKQKVNSIGPDILVNDGTGRTDEWWPSIAAAPNGKFMVVWRDDRSSKTAIYAQCFEGDGSRIGSNLKVSDRNVHQEQPAVAADGQGNFVVIWLDFGHPSITIHAKKYSGNGSQIGNSLKVDVTQSNGQQIHSPKVSADISGNFIITWFRSNHDIYAQRFSSDGKPIGLNFKVNDEPSDLRFPSIAHDGLDNFIIAWADQRNRDDSDTYAQRYLSDGNRIAENVKVNQDSMAANQSSVEVAADKMGNFVITWADERNSNTDIYAQYFTPDGAPKGLNVRVNDDVGSTNQWYPQIAVEANGNFIIVWKDLRNGRQDLYAQRYLSDGTKLGENVQLTQVKPTGFVSHEVALWENQIYVAWSNESNIETGYDVWVNIWDWDNPVGIYDDYPATIHSNFSLHQNYPNPFNPTTTIRYYLQKPGSVDLRVFNLRGQEIETLVSSYQVAGDYQINWIPEGLPGGIYFYRLRIGDFSETKKLILAR